MRFQAKLRKIGHSYGVLIPKNVITGYNIGDFIELDVITNKGEGRKVITELRAKTQNVITGEQHSTIKPKPELSSELELIPDESTQRPNNFKSS